jgi:hypothetical protein
LYVPKNYLQTSDVGACLRDVGDVAGDVDDEVDGLVGEDSDGSLGGEFDGGAVGDGCSGGIAGIAG